MLVDVFKLFLKTISSTSPGTANNLGPVKVQNSRQHSHETAPQAFENNITKIHSKALRSLALHCRCLQGFVFISLPGFRKLADLGTSDSEASSPRMPR